MLGEDWVDIVLKALLSAETDIQEHPDELEDIDCCDEEVKVTALEAEELLHALSPGEEETVAV